MTTPEQLTDHVKAEKLECFLCSFNPRAIVPLKLGEIFTARLFPLWSNSLCHIFHSSTEKTPWGSYTRLQRSCTPENKTCNWSLHVLLCFLRTTFFFKSKEAFLPPWNVTYHQGHFLMPCRGRAAGWKRSLPKGRTSIQRKSLHTTYIVIFCQIK